MKREYKGYYVTPDKVSPTLYYIATVGKGGKIPDFLSGLYTSCPLAYKAIDNYLNKKELKNAKTVSESPA